MGERRVCPKAEPKRTPSPGSGFIFWAGVCYAAQPRTRGGFGAFLVLFACVLVHKTYFFSRSDMIWG